jgi:hypothetical protein
MLWNRDAAVADRWPDSGKDYFLVMIVAARLTAF